jgi:hypothetical protein
MHISINNYLTFGKNESLLARFPKNGSFDTGARSHTLHKHGRGANHLRAALFGLGAALVMFIAIARAGFAALLPVPISTVPSNGDTNPYGVWFVTGRPGGSLNTGDILVSNFNNKNEVMGQGTTIVDIRNGAQRPTPFYTASIATAGEGVDLALGQLSNFIIIGNVPVTGATFNTPGPGFLTVLNSSGDIVTTLSDPKADFIDGPWGLAINQTGKTTAVLYVSNLLNATVWRLNVTFNAKAVSLTSETQIGGGYLKAINFPTAGNGPAGLAYDSKHDILYVASEQDNEIFSILDASKLSTTTSPGTVVYTDDTHLHGPTGLILLSNGDLLTASDDGVNPSTVGTGGAADPSEITEFFPSAPTGVFVTQYSVDPMLGGAFGLNISTTGNQTLLAYVDDNINALSILSLFVK